MAWRPLPSSKKRVRCSRKRVTPDGAGLPVYHLHVADNMVKNAEILQQMLLTNLGIQTEIRPVDTKLNFPMMVEGQVRHRFRRLGR
jgi:hypothetical protein